MELERTCRADVGEDLPLEGSGDLLPRLRTSGDDSPTSQGGGPAQAAPGHDRRVRVSPRPTTDLPDPVVGEYCDPGQAVGDPGRGPGQGGGQCLAAPQRPGEVEDLPEDVDLRLTSGSVPLADGPGTTVPGEVVEGELLRRFPAVDAAKDGEVAVLADRGAELPEGTRVVDETDPRQRHGCQRGVPQPGVPVVPRARRARPLGEGTRRGGDDASGFVAEGSEDDSRAGDGGSARRLPEDGDGEAPEAGVRRGSGDLSPVLPGALHGGDRLEPAPVRIGIRRVWRTARAVGSCRPVFEDDSDRSPRLHQDLALHPLGHRLPAARRGHPQCQTTAVEEGVGPTDAPAARRPPPVWGQAQADGEANRSTVRRCGPDQPWPGPEDERVVDDQASPVSRPFGPRGDGQAGIVEGAAVEEVGVGIPRSDDEATAPVGVEDPQEAGIGVEARPAEPGHVAVRVDERCGATVGEERVAADGVRAGHFGAFS